MILIFSGLNLATYATARKDLFDLIINRKNTMSNMYVGEGDMGMDYEVHDKEVYTSWDEVPDEAKEGILLPEYLPEGMELEEVTIMGTEPVRLEARYTNCENENQYLKICIKQFDNIIVKDQVTAPKAEYCGSEEINGVECYSYNMGEENLYVFTNNDNLYYLYGTVSAEEMKKIINSL